jgi:hypothetical protein
MKLNETIKQLLNKNLFIIFPLHFSTMTEEQANTAYDLLTNMMRILTPPSNDGSYSIEQLGIIINCMCGTLNRQTRLLEDLNARVSQLEHPQGI